MELHSESNLLLNDHPIGIYRSRMSYLRGIPIGEAHPSNRLLCISEFPTLGRPLPQLTLQSLRATSLSRLELSSNCYASAGYT